MVTITTLAARLGVNRATVHRRCQRGLLPARKLPDGTWIIAEDDAELARLDVALRPGPPPAVIAV